MRSKPKLRRQDGQWVVWPVASAPARNNAAIKWARKRNSALRAGACRPFTALFRMQ